MVTAKNNQAHKSPKRQYVVDAKGRRTAVILPIREYEELLEDLQIWR